MTVRFACSDTNFWIDSECLQFIELVFNLPLKYLIYEGTFQDEIEESIQTILLQHEVVSLPFQTIEEFIIAQNLIEKFPKISEYDAAACAIAKSRHISLITGDQMMRKAAESIGVEVHGTLWILDQIYYDSLISQQQYITILQMARTHSKVRWPEKEIEKRLSSFDL